MKKVVRTVIAILLCVTGLILLVLPSGVMEAATTRGDFVMEGTTLKSYIGKEADLTLPDTITEIGKDAFSGNVSLRNVYIPDSVKKINYAAFENCTNLKSVSIPESVRTIGSSAFSGCSSLYSVSIPRKVEEIGSGAFAGCTSLSSVPVSAQNPNFICQDGVIYSGDGKKLVQYLAGRPSTTYLMPESIEEISEYAFWGASDLTGVSISSKVKEIPEYAFSNCPGLSSIIIPTSVTKLLAYSFSDCANLRSVVIPTSVGYIDDLAFYLSEGVKVKMTDPSEMPATTAAVSAASTKGSEDADTVDEVEDIADDEEDDIPSDSEESQSKSYEEYILPGEIGSSVIVGGSAVMLISPEMKVKEAYHMDAAELEDGISANNTTSAGAEEFSIIRSRLVRYNGNQSSVTVPDEVNAIGNRVFYKNTEIEETDLPSDLEEIGDFAFARSSLTSIDIPEGTTDIGYAAFYQCGNLSDVSIPGSVENIELAAFLGTPWLNNWYQSDDGNYLVVGDGILLAYKGEGGNITLPENVKTVAAGCFEGNTTITGVSFPTGTVKIGEDAFNSCTNLNTISLPSGLETIEDRAFKNTGLTTLSIPPAVKSIGLGAFDVQNPKLSSVLFLGTELPDVSYKPTASRLSADNLRLPALNGIENAVVRDTADLNSGNIFDVNKLGFRGAIYSMTSSEQDQNTLTLLKCTKEPDTSGIVDISSKVQIGSTDYMVSGVKDSAFDSYKTISSWSSKPLKDVMVNGNRSSELDALLGSIQESEPEAHTEENAIEVRMKSSVFPSDGYAHAQISGNTVPYTLTVSDGGNSTSAINAAFYNAFGNTPDSSYVPFEMSLTDQSGGIPIKKLNKSRMEITLPIPSTLQNSDDLVIISLNDNGEMETLSTATTDVNGQKCLQFVTGHFSPFAIFRQGDLKATTTVETSDDDESILTESNEIDDSYDMFSIRAVKHTLNRNVGYFTAKNIISIVLIIAGLLIIILNTRLFKKNNKTKV